MYVYTSYLHIRTYTYINIHIHIHAHTEGCFLLRRSTPDLVSGALRDSLVRLRPSRADPSKSRPWYYGLSPAPPTALLKMLQVLGAEKALSRLRPRTLPAPSVKYGMEPP